MNYVKTAFLNRWNLLAVLGGTVFSFVSGQPDIVLPLLMAGEVAYLGFLGTHPKFRSYVDAQQAKATRAKTSEAAEKALRRIIQSLPRELLNRYESLRSQCAELRHIARELRSPGAEEMPLEGMQNTGLDRLLWIYLRLLYTQYALSRFLNKTQEGDIQRDIRRNEERLAQAPTDDSLQSQRIRKSLEDYLQTSRDRLENVQKARANLHLVQLEIERLEAKIRSLSEMAVNRQEPEYISSQVDSVASSMIETERTMNDLRFATGLDESTEEAPELLEAPLVRVRR